MKEKDGSTTGRKVHAGKVNGAAVGPPSLAPKHKAWRTVFHIFSVISLIGVALVWSFELFDMAGLGIALWMVPPALAGTTVDVTLGLAALGGPFAVAYFYFLAGMVVLSAIHDLTMAAQYADRLVLLDGGRIVADGMPGEVLVEENLARFPGARVSVIQGPDGSLIVAPRRPARGAAMPGTAATSRSRPPSRI